MIKTFEEHLDQYRVNIDNLSKIETLAKAITSLFKEIFKESFFSSNWSHPHVCYIQFYKFYPKRVFDCAITLTPISNSIRIELNIFDIFDKHSEVNIFLLFLRYVISPKKDDNEYFVHFLSDHISVSAIDDLISKLSKLNIDDYKLYIDAKKYNL